MGLTPISTIFGIVMLNLLKASSKQKESEMKAASPPQFRIEYTKTFLSGNLKGFSVESSYGLPLNSAIWGHHENVLKGFTESHPGADCTNGNAKFKVSNVRIVKA